MLAPLGVYLVITLIACALALLICWAYDAYTAEIEAPQAIPVVLKFPVYSQQRRLHLRRSAPRLLNLGRRLPKELSGPGRDPQRTSPLIPS
jgi:hypothetical protein